MRWFWDHWTQRRLLWTSTWMSSARQMGHHACQAEKETEQELGTDGIEEGEGDEAIGRKAERRKEEWENERRELLKRNGIKTRHPATYGIVKLMKLVTGVTCVIHGRSIKCSRPCGRWNRSQNDILMFQANALCR